MVIAILAAITIVAYNGITSSANDSARRADVQAIEKAIQLRDVEHGASLPDNSYEYPYSYNRAEILALYGLESMTERVFITNTDEGLNSVEDVNRQKTYLYFQAGCPGIVMTCSVPMTVKSVSVSYWSNADNAWRELRYDYEANGQLEKHGESVTSFEYGPFGIFQPT